MWTGRDDDRDERTGRRSAAGAYELKDGAGLVHRLRGQGSNRKLDGRLTLPGQQLMAARYADFDPTLASEMLAQHHGIIFIGRERVSA